ncbi:hypothetical protein [Halodurantibacterium flavum]|uniref:Uncharacterized protein n=1 Tax=Halodurantibacterium flavum TaxID=1382802 RepID=A0ABW4S753_9RHOB
MDWLVWIGAAMTVAGIAGIGWCVTIALRLRRAALSEEEQRARLQRAVIINISSLGLSALGLALVVTGIILG